MNARLVKIALAAVLVTLAACGGTDSGEDVAGDEGPVANACPADGCTVTVTDATSAGDELEVSWDANFLPDVSRNHIHVYWDNYSAEQVSSDAEANGLEQGEWVPTDAYPTYTTDGAVSVGVAGSSTTLCVTAADRDHAVLDPALEHCVDVSEDL
jgi:hypothetical protein